MSEVSSGGMEATTSEPISFEQALAADASPASDPSDSSEHVAPTAEQSETTETVADQRQPSGSERERFIPRERFDAVNRKYNELKAWREQRAWADQIDPSTFQQMVQFYGQASRDPRAFALQLLDELVNSPEHAAAVRSELARRLATGTAQAGDGLPEPDVELTDAQGRVIGRTYSDKQLALRDEFMRRQMLADIKRELQPQFQTLDALKAERETILAHQQAQTFATGFMQELAGLPLFAEHKAEIGKALAGMQLDSDHPSEVKAAAYRAYLQVVGPKLGGNRQATKDVLADLQRKAAAGSSVNPGAAAGGAPKPITSFDDARLEW